MTLFRTLSLCLATTTLAACPATEDADKDTDVTDTDVTDTDVEDTDVEDTDVEDTDVEDTDVAVAACAYDGVHTRVVIDPTTATAQYYAPPSIAAGGPSFYTEWTATNSTGGTLAMTERANSALVVEFSPPIVLGRVPSVDGYRLTVGSNVGANIVVPIDPELTYTTTTEGTLGSTFESSALFGTAMEIRWGWNGYGKAIAPVVGETLTCIAFDIAADETATYSFDHVTFEFYDATDTTGSFNPLQAAPAR